MEIAHVADRRGLEVRHAADRRVLVRVRRERVVVDDLRQPAVRLVLDAHPPLFLHDLALAPERRRRRRAASPCGRPRARAPAAGTAPAPSARTPSSSSVRVGVAASADARDDRGVRLGLDVLRALEHHVLEEVREPGAARPLVLRADVIPDRDVHDRRRVILGQDHAQPVRQRRDLVLELRRPDRSVQRRQGDARRTRRRSAASEQRRHGEKHIPAIIAVD